MIRVDDNWVILVDAQNYTPVRDPHRTKQVLLDDGTEKTEHVYGKPLGYYTTLAGAQETVEKFEKIMEGIKE